MVEILTANNKKAVIEVAPMVDAMALKRVVFKELASNGIDLNALMGGKSIKDIDVNSFAGTIFNLLGSEELENALLNCLKRSSYDREKIRIDLFDSETAREDYYELLLKCAEINLKPFIKGLASACNPLLTAIPTADSQKSE